MIINILIISIFFFLIIVITYLNIKDAKESEKIYKQREEEKRLRNSAFVRNNTIFLIETLAGIWTPQAARFYCKKVLDRFFNCRSYTENDLKDLVDYINLVFRDLKYPYVLTVKKAGKEYEFYISISPQTLIAN